MSDNRDHGPRVALFADTYGQMNGAAMTLGRLVDFAEQRGRPMLCLHGGRRTESTVRGSVKEIAFRQSALSVRMDEELAFDPLFLRHFRRIMAELREFKPDIVHITGLNDVSIAGCLASRRLNIPVVATWHTNIHEFASRRLRDLLRFMPKYASDSIAAFSERQILRGTLLYHKIPHLILAPNPDLVTLLQQKTGREATLMTRGVDTVRFSPDRRTLNDGIFRFGFVGRLRPEKNVRMLIDVANEIPAEHQEKVRFLIVGVGSELDELKRSLPNADFPGFLSGEELYRAYANIDVFLFPSESDAFGNVVREANASGVPAIVTDKGGPMFQINEGFNGYIARNSSEFIDRALRLLGDPILLSEMKANARRSAEGYSWDAVFESVYSAYTDLVNSNSLSMNSLRDHQRQDNESYIDDVGSYVSSK